MELVTDRRPHKEVPVVETVCLIVANAALLAFDFGSLVSAADSRLGFAVDRQS